VKKETVPFTLSLPKYEGRGREREEEKAKRRASQETLHFSQHKKIRR